MPSSRLTAERQPQRAPARVRVPMATDRNQIVAALHCRFGTQAVQRMFVQRVVNESQAVNTLRSILDGYGQSNWYRANWPANVKRIARSVAERAALAPEATRTCDST